MTLDSERALALAHRVGMIHRETRPGSPTASDTGGSLLHRWPSYPWCGLTMETLEVSPCPKGRVALWSVEYQAELLYCLIEHIVHELKDAGVFSLTWKNNVSRRSSEDGVGCGAEHNDSAFLEPGYDVCLEDLGDLHRAAWRGIVPRVELILMLRDPGLDKRDKKKRSRSTWDVESLEESQGPGRFMSPQNENHTQP
eukprot:XP_016876378.1 uncharacterized protein LOC101928764 isoform X2 [Homo sapiens]